MSHWGTAFLLFLPFLRHCAFNPNGLTTKNSNCAAPKFRVHLSSRAWFFGITSGFEECGFDRKMIKTIMQNYEDSTARPPGKVKQPWETPLCQPLDAADETEAKFTTVNELSTVGPGS